MSKYSSHCDRDGCEGSIVEEAIRKAAPDRPPGIAVVCLEEGAGRPDLDRVLRHLGYGPEPHVGWRWFDQGLLTARVAGRASEEELAAVQAIPGVRRAVVVRGADGLAGRGDRPRARVDLGLGASVGDGQVAVIAGPCSVESKAQVCDVAAMVKAAGAIALRGGAFKPRTSPYSFGGLGATGLEYLALARERTGLPIVTEVLDLDCLDVVAQYADVLQVGSRNMHNFSLLFRIGCHPSGKPVLLKRGFAATVDELLQAAEYVLLGRYLAGHELPGVILCERGIRTFEPSLRFTLDVGAIPVLAERTHLPVIVDPSHAAGVRRFVAPLARAALAAGADGLLVEAHVDPSRAWCDAEQSLDPQEFGDLMAGVRTLLGMRSSPSRAADDSDAPPATA